MNFFKQVTYTTTTQTTGISGSVRRSVWSRFLATFATVSSVVLVLMVGPSYGQTATQKENTQKETTRIQPQGTKTQLNSAQLASEPDISPAALRPFHINVPEADLVDLRRRVLATRWPDAAWTYSGGDPERALTRDEMLDDITLYWLTNTGTSSSRSYWDAAQGGGGPFTAIDIPKVPVA